MGNGGVDISPDVAPYSGTTKELAKNITPDVIKHGQKWGTILIVVLALLLFLGFIAILAFLYLKKRKKH